jgi:hypothetical protein
MMNADDFFGIQSFLTLGGATVIVTVITNGLKYAFRLKPRYIALVVSFIVILIGMIIKKELSVEPVLLAVPNTFLLYISSVGLATVSTGITGKSDTNRRHPQQPQRPIEEIPSEESPEMNNVINQQKMTFWAPWF